jgi:hypothetical protein
MKRAASMLLCLLTVLAACVPGRCQETVPMSGGPFTTCTEAPVCGLPGVGPTGCHWTYGCFPRCGCPDDYCPHPYPRQCWPPYPSFYRCVPAGECCHPRCVGVGNEKLTWWFFPTPRALREALWCQP